MNEFDYIIAREAHPFTRSGDWDLHRNILDQIISSLSNEGIVCIAHASFGGNMKFDSINFQKTTEYLNDNGFKTIDPVCFFLFKHFKIKPKNRVLNIIISKVSIILQRLLNQRWISFYIAYRKIEK